MNTITYYDIINDTTVTLEFKYHKPVPWAYAREIINNIIKPIHYYVNKIEITDNNIKVTKNNDTIDIVKDISIVSKKDYNIFLSELFENINQEYIDWLKCESELRERCKISIIYSRHEEYEDEDIAESDFTKSIEIVDKYFEPFDSLEKLFEYLMKEANYRKDFINFGNLSNITFNTIWYKEFYGQIGKKYNIHQIKRIDEHYKTVEILYSDGICTNGIKHICGEARKWFDECKAKIDNIETEANNYFTNLLAP